MTAERMTLKQWEHHLLAPDAQLTLSELMALVLLNIRENMEHGAQGTQHLEGMVGTLDDFLAGTNPLYQAVAAKRSKPAPALTTNANGVSDAV
jgi:hypothetical protein